MSKPIQVGDLVLVVKPRACCGSPGRIGYVSQVFEIQEEKTGFCPDCGAVTVAKGVLLELGWGHMNRVIRIDPPAQDESTNSDNQLKEHA
jgi:hypothetical protein